MAVEVVVAVAIGRQAIGQGVAAQVVAEGVAGDRVIPVHPVAQLAVVVLAIRLDGGDVVIKADFQPVAEGVQAVGLQVIVAGDAAGDGSVSAIPGLGEPVEAVVLVDIGRVVGTVVALHVGAVAHIVIAVAVSVTNS